MKKNDARLRIKKLPLQAWQKSFARKEQGLASPMEMRIGKGSFNQSIKEYQRDGVCVLSDGYYLQGNSVWFSFAGVKYSLKPESKSAFLSLLDGISAIEEIGLMDDVHALAKLELKVYGSITEKTRRLRGAVSAILARRKIRLHSLRFRKGLAEKRANESLN
ncbi:hypothetical protein OTK49_21315 [Vibrio coralliirubri]|uniref:hypothetical protein n=1 Tax=Vibrio coralliirubri TaxID=1516159 RepID=UPI0022849FA2|nr:hypothetical protein [Vibrio coralliirubri]MCY9865061.1 hypothetical protein [Vibrio coralliirubri]